jgi:DivIVA domain-containing protein
MSLTPEEIAEKEFLVGLRGYDKDEVRAFLNQVAQAFAAASGGSAPAAAAAPAAASGGTDWSNVGDEIAAVLRTAHEQAATLRADAERDVASLRSQAEADAETKKAAAERKHSEADEKLSTAQTDALNLVAEAQSRVDRMIETSKIKAKEEAETAISDLTRQIDELTRARADALASLNVLNDNLSSTIRSVGG